MNLLPRMVRYKSWADSLLYASLAELSAHDLTAARPIVFGSILHTLNHVLLMDQVWQAHLEGRPHGQTTRSPADSPGFEAVRQAQVDIDAWYVAYADSLSDSTREEVVEFSFIGGGPGAMTREDIVLHVVNHATYHRGHIGDMLYVLEVEPPTTDLPVFLTGDSATG